MSASSSSSSGSSYRFPSGKLSSSGSSSASSSSSSSSSSSHRFPAGSSSSLSSSSSSSQETRFALRINLEDVRGLYQAGLANVEENETLPDLWIWVPEKSAPNSDVEKFGAYLHRENVQVHPRYVRSESMKPQTFPPSDLPVVVIVTLSQLKYIDKAVFATAFSDTSQQIVLCALSHRADLTAIQEYSTSGAWADLLKTYKGLDRFIYALRLEEKLVVVGTGQAAAAYNYVYAADAGDNVTIITDLKERAFVSIGRKYWAGPRATKPTGSSTSSSLEDYLASFDFGGNGGEKPLKPVSATTEMVLVTNLETALRHGAKLPTAWETDVKVVTHEIISNSKYKKAKELLAGDMHTDKASSAQIQAIALRLISYEVLVTRHKLFMASVLFEVGEVFPRFSRSGVYGSLWSQVVHKASGAKYPQVALDGASVSRLGAIAKEAYKFPVAGKNNANRGNEAVRLQTFGVDGLDALDNLVAGSPAAVPYSFYPDVKSLQVAQVHAWLTVFSVLGSLRDWYTTGPAKVAKIACDLEHIFFGKAGTASKLSKKTEDAAPRLALAAASLFAASAQLDSVSAKTAMDEGEEYLVPALEKMMARLSALVTFEVGSPIANAEAAMDVLLPWGVYPVAMWDKIEVKDEDPEFGYNRDRLVAIHRAIASATKPSRPRLVAPKHAPAMKPASSAKKIGGGDGEGPESGGGWTRPQKPRASAFGAKTTNKPSGKSSSSPFDPHPDVHEDSFREYLSSLDAGESLFEGAQAPQNCEAELARTVEARRDASMFRGQLKAAETDVRRLEKLLIEKEATITSDKEAELLCMQRVEAAEKSQKGSSDRATQAEQRLTELNRLFSAQKGQLEEALWNVSQLQNSAARDKAEFDDARSAWKANLSVDVQRLIDTAVNAEAARCRSFSLEDLSKSQHAIDLLRNEADSANQRANSAEASFRQSDAAREAQVAVSLSLSARLAQAENLVSLLRGEVAAKADENTRIAEGMSHLVGLLGADDSSPQALNDRVEELRTTVAESLLSAKTSDEQRDANIEKHNETVTALQAEIEKCKRELKVCSDKLTVLAFKGMTPEQSAEAFCEESIKKSARLTEELQRSEASVRDLEKKASRSNKFEMDCKQYVKLLTISNNALISAAYEDSVVLNAPNALAAIKEVNKLLKTTTGDIVLIVLGVIPRPSAAATSVKLEPVVATAVASPPSSSIRSSSRGQAPTSPIKTEPIVAKDSSAKRDDGDPPLVLLAESIRNVSALINNDMRAYSERKTIATDLELALKMIKPKEAVSTKIQLIIDLLKSDGDLKSGTIDSINETLSLLFALWGLSMTVIPKEYTETDARAFEDALSKVVFSPEAMSEDQGKGRSETTKTLKNFAWALCNIKPQLPSGARWDQETKKNVIRSLTHAKMLFPTNNSIRSQINELLARLNGTSGKRKESKETALGTPLDAILLILGLSRDAVPDDVSGVSVFEEIVIFRVSQNLQGRGIGVIVATKKPASKNLVSYRNRSIRTRSLIPTL